MDMTFFVSFTVLLTKDNRKMGISNNNSLHSGVECNNIGGMFQNLFRNHGERPLGVLMEQLERLVTEAEEGGQRCAAELVAGAARGCKHWPLAASERLWTSLVPIARRALSRVTVDTVTDWGVCFATASENRDPSRQHHLLELLMEEPFTNQSASFVDCAKMYALQGALNQQAWRLGELRRRLLTYLQPYLAHPFQNVRDRVASVLVNVFEPDMAWSADPRLDIAAFVEQVAVPRVSNLLEDDEIACDNPAKEEAVRLLKTMCKLMIGVISRTNYGLQPAFYRLFDVLVSVQGHEVDEELAALSVAALALLAQSLTLAKHSNVALDAVSRAAKSRSWSARAAVADYLQVFVFHNMHLLSADNASVQRVKDVVLGLLEDERPEVRVQAGQALSGLLHCHFLPDADTHVLLERFTRAARHRHQDIRITHGAVLGLCAFVSAWPYAVPPHVPGVLAELGAQLARPQPIPATIRHTMGHFKRTHHDDWPKHQLAFTPAQLDVLQDLNVPPSYYA